MLVARISLASGRARRGFATLPAPIAVRISKFQFNSPDAKLGFLAAGKVGFSPARSPVVCR